MKKITCLFIIVMSGLFVSARRSNSQAKDSSDFERTLNVQFEKSSYFLLEPLYARFKLTLPSTDSVPNLSQGALIRVFYKEKSREFHGLTSIISHGEPQPMTNKNAAGKDIVAGYYDYEEEEVIDRVQELFPEPGEYKLQFILGETESNVIDVTIEEPTGINKEAFNFLSKYTDALSFYWIWKEKNGASLLETFINKYGQSVYGEFAIEYLANVYLAKGELEKSEAEFEKIKFSKNRKIAKYAQQTLEEITKRRADLQKQPE